MGTSTRDKMKGYIVLIALVFAFASAEDSGRNPRLFFASVFKSTSTSTSTTTMSTYSFCYTTVTKVNANCRRKKSYNMEEDNIINYDIQPSTRTGLDGTAGEKPSYRDARLFLLVTSTSTVTATATSTLTSYTGTYSLSVSCTPTKGPLAACGK